MPSFLLEFLKLTFELIGLFFVISFLVGVGQFFINPKSKIFTFSRNNKFLSACCGALLGGVTPFCSCSTIPLFVGFVKSKAPFSTSIAFLLASPIMNPAILTLMGVFFGIKTAILYGLCTFIFAVLFGLVLEKFGFEKEIYDISITGGKEESQMWSELTGTFGMRLKTVIQTSIFNSLLLLRKVFPYLLVGTAIGALIHGLLPVSVVQKVAGIPAWFSVPAAALIGIPLYIRTETIIPMATVLQSVGLGPGVLVSLMIGAEAQASPKFHCSAPFLPRRCWQPFLSQFLPSLAQQALFLTRY